MPLPELKLDNRTYRALLNEALARIPVHNPEWTNFNDSDPGVTLLQLFSYLSEAIIYRSNLIPERNRAKFLQLLGIPLRPAEPSKGIVQFSNPTGKLVASIINDDAELFAGKVPFRTLNGLQLLPIDTKIYYKSPLSKERETEISELYSSLYASYKKPDTNLEFYETKSLEFPSAGNFLPTIDLSKNTVDGALWLAILARKDDDPDDVRDEIANQTLTLGVMPSLDEEQLVLYPQGQPQVEQRTSLIFETPIVEEGKGASYRLLNAVSEQDVLKQPGVVQVTLPGKNDSGNTKVKDLSFWTDLDPLEPGVGNYPPWIEDENELVKLVTWIRIRSPEVETEEDVSSRQLKVGISWLGINAANVIQRAQVTAERLPNGNGEPDQKATLAHTPVILDSVKLYVNGELWTRVDDLLVAQPEIEVRSPRLSGNNTNTLLSPASAYTLDREAGVITFGDGVHGKRPPANAVIQVSYDYGGGKEGRVGIGSIKTSNLSNNVKVINPIPTWGGEERESISQAEKRIPSVLRHRERLVSIEDFKDITLSTPGVHIGRVEVLPLTHPNQIEQDSPGVVTVLVIPQDDPRQPLAPKPDRLFLQAICEYLSPRRVLTTELHLHGPEYVPVWISLSIEVISGFDEGPVRESVRQAILDFLSPLSGGFTQEGWPLNKRVDAAEISATAARVNGVAKIEETLLGTNEGATEIPIEIAGLQLPHIMAVSVVSGTNAVSINELRGNVELSGDNADPTATSGSVPASVVPVPVIPDLC